MRNIVLFESEMWILSRMHTEKENKHFYKKNDILELYKTSISKKPSTPRIERKEPENDQTDGNQAEVILKCIVE
jgi:hypothetical protein